MAAGATRLIGLTVLLVCVAAATRFTTRAANEQPTDYDVELAQIRAAIAALSGTGAAAPVDAERVTRLAHLLYRRAALTGSAADFRDAEVAIGAAIQQIGPTDDLSLVRAHLDFALHRFAAAGDDLAGVADLPDAVALKADIDVQRGRYDEARAGYAAAIQRSRTWDNLARLAYLQSVTGDDAAADALYVEAEDEITAKEMRAYAWVEVQRGLLQLRRGRFPEASALYQHANRAYSGYWLVEEHLAELYGARRQFDAALALYRTINTRAPKPELAQAVGDLYAFMGKPAEAAPWHEQALAGYLASVQRGDVLYVHHLAGFYADVRGDGAAAVRWARQDLAVRQSAAAHDALAWALYRDDQFQAALGEIDRALAAGAQDAHLFFHAAMIYLAAGRGDAGRQLLRHAAEINPRFEAFHVHR